MKTIVPILALAAMFSTDAVAGPYYYGGYAGGRCGYGGYWGGYRGCSYYGGGCNFWPGFAVGIGLGAIATCLDYSYRRSEPVYYAVPTSVYSYNPPVYSAPATPAPAVPADPPKPAVWVPASPGTGQWVPDPTPYSYAGSVLEPRAKPASSSSTVSQTSSPGGVPVYAISR
jgi:hypothetical protein